MAFDLYGSPIDMYDSLLQNRKNKGSGGNGGNGADGKGDGSGFKINPFSAIKGISDGLGNTISAAMQPKFDYGQDNYTAAQAGQAEGQRAAGIAKSATSAIPLVGGLLGGIFGAIAQKVAANKAESRATFVLGNRQSHINNLQDLQMNKIKENNFLKSSDLYKNMFDQENNNNNNNNTFV